MLLAVVLCGPLSIGVVVAEKRGRGNFCQVGKQALYAYYIGYVRLPKFVICLHYVGGFRLTKDFFLIQNNGYVTRT